MLEKKLADPNFVDKMDMPLDPEYIDDSYQVDVDGETEDSETGKNYSISE